jgi:nicotinate-nucleotide pyrophosphorylase (carboxylating)
MTDLSTQLQSRVREDVSNALHEDMGSGDLTAQLVPVAQQASARVTAREAAVVCGQPWFTEVFRQLEPAIEVRWHIDEGARAAADDLICEISGPARAILTGERSALNFLQTLSATATLAAAYNAAVSDTGCTVLDTRKTLPGLRLAQKYAVKCGGATNHRIGLYDGILIKENHIFSAGGVASAVQSALDMHSDVLVEVEVESLDEAREAMTAGAHRLLLDNFSLAQMRDAVALRDQEYTDITLEASGNVTLETIADIAATGVDFVSVGALTKDVKAVDFSMRFENQDE